MRRILWVIFVLALMIPSPALAQQTISDGVVYATAQPFDHGLMLWRSDNSDIWVLAETGIAFYFSPLDYSPLPDNPIFGSPASRLRPIFGMGKVWGNHAAIRALIGWPTGPEVGFSMPVYTAGGVQYFTQLDNTVIEVTPDGTWARYPASTVARVQSVSVTPNPVPPGGIYTVSWQAAGAEMVIIEVYDANTNQQYGMFPDYPLVGSADIPVPDFASFRLSIIVWAANKHRGTSSYDAVWFDRLAQSSVTLDIDTTNIIVDSVQAAYQLFERGFMIWRADTGTVYVFFGQGGGQFSPWSQVAYQNLPDNPFWNMPAGTVRPINAFGKVWGNDEAVRRGLGYAVADETGYVGNFSSQYGALLTLTTPDNRTVSITQPRWWKIP